ncbi:MAG: hypothetical protein ACK4KW_06870 [Gemmobacter sp.]
MQLLERSTERLVIEDRAPTLAIGGLVAAAVLVGVTVSYTATEPGIKALIWLALAALAAFGLWNAFYSQKIVFDRREGAIWLFRNGLGGRSVERLELGDFRRTVVDVEHASQRRGGPKARLFIEIAVPDGIRRLRVNRMAGQTSRAWGMAAQINGWFDNGR